MEYYTTVKKNEPKTTWINLKNLTLNKRSQPQKTEHYDFIYMKP